MERGGTDGFYYDLDASEFNKKMALLMDKQQNQFVRAAIRDSLRPLYSKTKKGAKGAYSRNSSGKSRLRKPPEMGVQLRVGKYGDYGKVNLAGNPVLHLMELGTKMRYTGAESKGKSKKKKIMGKPQYRGQMKAKLFFQSARQSEEGSIINTFETKLNQRIEKLWNS